MLTPYRRKTHRSRVARELAQLNRTVSSVAEDLVCMGLRLRMLEAANGLDPDTQIKSAREISSELARRCK